MKIIIAGAYAIGIHLAKLLSRNNEDITLMDEDLDRLSHINDEYDLLTMEANPSSIEAMKEAGVEHADLYIGVTPDEALNLNCCIMAKALGAKKTVAKIDNPEFTDPKLQAFFDNLGVSSLIYPEMLAAIDINNGLKMSWVRQRWDVHDGALVMLVIKLREECEILNEPLKNICGPNDPFHIVAIKRQGETIIPGGNDELKLFDMAYFMTTKNYIPYIRTIVGKEHYADVKNVMVMGAGQTAVRAIKTMPNYMGVKIIEIDNQRCQELNNILDDNVLVINGDGRDVPLLIEEGIKNTQAFVALTGNAETNILACLTAKRLGVRKTVAMVENTDYVAMAENLDIGTIINRKTIAASRIYQMMLDADVMNVRFLDSANADVAEFIVQEGAKVTKHPVKDLGMPIGVTIGGLVRQGEGMLVSGNTQIMPGDSVMVFCHNINMKKIEKYFIS
ncbi:MULTISPECIES: Trk system potassium transporter TrkA [Segatella]|jgi:trk system potassium uptake protein TrkA|uniref:Trk system potassium uptake protein TrkA n=2 Tax=Segatella TaxID=2974251 RepID=D8DYE3_9BACT|nr:MULTISPECIES: Trk system potassium transporter TrkA [Segatella]EFI71568.1 potassium uptake protein TrkA [Segatella baroniae B14]MDR4931834.1 Trk system potassium transporter TrkA [Segatella bryantii]OYP57258.1 Trk system potassium transport protein TrkA [Segatella bryantii]UKK77437.1 Trk system potassium transporter TrkA [Segatella baroniae B14]UKK80498.1 Trk system potassium transporter TrkA [Segatella bryantii]